MRLTDHYIISRFLVNFVILLFVLISLIVLIDLVANLDEFLDAARQMVLQQRFGLATLGEVKALELDKTEPVSFRQLLPVTGWIVWDWHAPLSVLIYVYLSGLIAVGAMGFTFNDLARKGEIIAMVTSGVSMFRVAAPVLVVGSLMSLTALPIQEFVIPALAGKLARTHNQLGRQGIHSFAVRFAHDGEGNLLSASKFDPQPGVEALEDIHILVRDQKGSPIRVITAQQALWSASPAGWELIDAYEQRPSSVLAGQTASRTTPMREIDFFPTSLSPQVLIARRAEIYPSLLSIGELRRLARGPAASTAHINQIIHRRFSMMAVNMLVLVMGLPFFLCREPTNMLLQAVRAAAVCLGGWASSMVIVQLGQGQLPPVAAAWLPVVIFLPLSAYLMQRIKT